MNEIDVDVVVIGAGPAGVAAAREAARAGRCVALIERPDRIGGRHTHQTTLPRRALAKLAGARTAIGDADFAQLRAEAAARADRWADRVALGLEDAGVAIVSGEARFLDAHRVAVHGPEAIETVRFERAIVATGARARTLPGAAPDRRALFMADDLLALGALPAEAMVIGGGRAGAEITDLLSRAGVKTTWVMDELGVLPSFDRELAEAVGDVLMERGVKLVHGKTVAEVSIGAPGAMARLDGGRTYAAPVAFVAVGDRPHTEDLCLDALGLELDRLGAIAVDPRGRTALPHVWAAGEVTAWARDAATSEAMGRVAGRSAADLDDEVFEPARVPRAAHTHPEVAQVGLSPDVSVGHEVVLHTLRIEESLLGAIEGAGERSEPRGFVRVVCSSRDGAVLGASALGTGAIEIVNAVALAMAVGATERDLARTFASLPSRLDLPFRAAR